MPFSPVRYKTQTDPKKRTGKMPLSPNEIKNILYLSESLREWSINPKLEKEGPESNYFGSSVRCMRTGDRLPVGTENEFDGSDRSLHETVTESLLDLDIKLAHEFEMKVEELHRRAIQVDLRKKTPDFVKDYAAEIAKELEYIATTGGRVTGNVREIKNKPKKWTVELANEAILPVITKYAKNNLLILTIRFLEEKSSVPHSTIQKTENWKALQKMKENYKDEQGKMKHKPANFSHKMQSITTRNKYGTFKVMPSHKKKNIEGDDHGNYDDN
jgi:hypothetical protein